LFFIAQLTNRQPQCNIAENLLSTALRMYLVCLKPIIEFDQYVGAVRHYNRPISRVNEHSNQLADIFLRIGIKMSFRIAETRQQKFFR